MIIHETMKFKLGFQFFLWMTLNMFTLGVWGSHLWTANVKCATKSRNHIFFYIHEFVFSLPAVGNYQKFTKRLNSEMVREEIESFVTTLYLWEIVLNSAAMSAVWYLDLLCCLPIYSYLFVELQCFDKFSYR